MNYSTGFFNSSFINRTEFFAIAREINIYSTFVILVIGIFGHSTTLYVYSHKKFRNNSSNYYTIFLACIDSVYLFAHMFEDTFRTIKDAQLDDVHYLIDLFNIIDRNIVVCRLVNYLRNVLRFMSAYVILVFTIQRALVVSKPLYNRFKSRKSALIAIFLISYLSLFMNTWALFMFEIQKNEFTQYCDVKKSWSFAYLIINVIYMILVMIIPILLILGFNFLIIFKISQNVSQRVELRPLRSRRDKTDITRLETLPSKETSEKRSLACYFSINYIAKRQNLLDENDKVYSSKRVTKVLLFISFSYAFFNIPYAISWVIFFVNFKFYQVDPKITDFIFSFVQLSETLSVLNYGINFYLLCLSGKLFRDQLKYSFAKLFRD